MSEQKEEEEEEDSKGNQKAPLELSATQREVEGFQFQEFNTGVTVVKNSESVRFVEL